MRLSFVADSEDISWQHFVADISWQTVRIFRDMSDLIERVLEPEEDAFKVQT